MAGLLDARSGSLLWNDDSVADDPERHNARLHYVGHLDAVKATMTPYENLQFWSGLRGGTRQQIDHALDIFDLSHLKNMSGRFLSAGQKRRVNLARILAARGQIWLLDEPTTALDARSTENLKTAIKQHRENGGMVVLSTHHKLNLDNETHLDLSHFQSDDDLSWYAESRP